MTTPKPKSRHPKFQHKIAYKTAKLERILFRYLGLTFELQDENRRWAYYSTNNFILDEREYFAQIMIFKRHRGWGIEWFYFNEENDEMESVDFMDIFEHLPREVKHEIVYYLDILK